MEWKDICIPEGYSDIYEISEYGDLRNKKTGRILKPSFTKDYKVYSMQIDNVRKTVRAHQLVAFNFLGVPENYGPGATQMTIDHIDENKHNNHYSNLRYITNQENSSSRNTGGKNGQSKLTEKEVREIMALQGSKTQKEIAATYGITDTSVRDIFKKRTWAHLWTEAE